MPDEPAVGLRVAGVERLIRALHRLVDAGNTVVAIEHNLDVWAEAGWIVDLGPEGGDSGGEVVTQASPEVLATRASRPHAGRALTEFLEARGSGTNRWRPCGAEAVGNRRGEAAA